MLKNILIITVIASIWDFFTISKGIYVVGIGEASEINLGIVALALIGALVISSFLLSTTQIWNDLSHFNAILFRVFWCVAIIINLIMAQVANLNMMNNRTPPAVWLSFGLTLVISAAPITLGAMLKRMGKI